jgi:Fe-Mn family superoxide dismutase
MDRPLMGGHHRQRPAGGDGQDDQERGISRSWTALVAVGALAVGMMLGRQTAPAPAELLSVYAARRGPGLSGLAQGRATQKKAETVAAFEIDAYRFPGETDHFLFQPIGAPLSGSPTGTYNPYLDDIKDYPFHNFYIPVSKESAADEIFSLPPLPYAYDSLEPYIDRFTMFLHHDKHFDAYRQNLNAALAADPELTRNLVALQASAISGGNVAVRNNGGGFYNHGLFFSTLAPASKATLPSEELLAVINKDFGSLDAVKAAFRDKALKQFGSGWAWLGPQILQDGSLGPLQVTATKNQDNPLIIGVEAVRMLPILGLDVWEHAYYLEYQNKRADYIDSFWNVVDWYTVSQYYKHYASQGQPVDWHPI